LDIAAPHALRRAVEASATVLLDGIGRRSRT
jgi:hypothetical protein